MSCSGPLFPHLAQPAAARGSPRLGGRSAREVYEPLWERLAHAQRGDAERRREVLGDGVVGRPGGERRAPTSEPSKTAGATAAASLLGCTTMSEQLAGRSRIARIERFICQLCSYCSCGKCTSTHPTGTQDKDNNNQFGAPVSIPRSESCKHIWILLYYTWKPLKIYQHGI